MKKKIWDSGNRWLLILGKYIKMRLKYGPSHLVQFHILIAYNVPTGAPFSNLIGVMPLVEIQAVCLSKQWNMQTVCRDYM